MEAFVLPKGFDFILFGFKVKISAESERNFWLNFSK